MITPRRQGLGAIALPKLRERCQMLAPQALLLVFVVSFDCGRLASLVAREFSCLFLPRGIKPGHSAEVAWRGLIRYKKRMPQAQLHRAADDLLANSLLGMLHTASARYFIKFVRAP
jgi:hypothetical protein